MPTPATIRVVQIEPGPCPTLIASAPQSARNSTPAALVTLPAMSGNFWKCVAQNFHHVADAFRVAVRGGNGDRHPRRVRRAADVFKDSFFVQFAERIARGRDRRAANEMEVRIARGLELRERVPA
jgi:hypothetical protein